MMRVKREQRVAGIWIERTFDANNNIRKAEWSDGLIAYYDENGQMHNEAGPAIIWTSGKPEWRLHGKIIKVKSQQEFEQYMRLKAFW